MDIQLVEKTLATEVNTDKGKMSVKQFLGLLLITLWEKGEAFCGKRPLGNSGWDEDIYDQLRRNRLITKTSDGEGLIKDCIKYLTYPVL